MSATIADFMEACREFNVRMGTADSPAFFRLALYEAGGAFIQDEGRAIASADDLVDAILSGEIVRSAERGLERWLRKLVAQGAVSEENLVAGLSRKIEGTLESLSEDTSRRRSDMERRREWSREHLGDPVRREESAERINRMLPDDVPEVSPDELVELDEEMYDAYMPPSTLEYLKLTRTRLDTWRSVRDAWRL